MYDIILLALWSLSLLLADFFFCASHFDSFEFTLLQLQAPLHLLNARLKLSCFFLQTFYLFFQFGLLTSQILFLSPETSSFSWHLSFQLLIGRANFLQLLFSLLQGKLKIIDWDLKLKLLGVLQLPQMKLVLLQLAVVSLLQSLQHLFVTSLHLHNLHF